MQHFSNSRVGGGTLYLAVCNLQWQIFNQCPRGTWLQHDSNVQNSTWIVRVSSLWWFQVQYGINNKDHRCLIYWPTARSDNLCCHVLCTMCCVLNKNRSDLWLLTLYQGCSIVPYDNPSFIREYWEHQPHVCLYGYRATVMTNENLGDKI